MDTTNGEQKVLALTAHLSYLIGGLGFLLVPLLIYLLKKDDPFVREHALQAFVAHLALLIAGMAVGLLCFLLIGFLLVPVLIGLTVLLLVTSLIASVKVLNGEMYYYPLIQGLIGKLR